MRRDDFDDTDWTGADYYAKSVVWADAQGCVLALYSHGTARDYKVALDFRRGILATAGDSPPSVSLTGAAGAIQAWHVSWNAGKPTVTDTTTTALPTFVLLVPKSTPTAIIFLYFCFRL